MQSDLTSAGRNGDSPACRRRTRELHRCLMSCCRLQAQVDVPPETLWELVGDVDRHPEWWPRVLDVQCEGLEQGCSYRQVFQSPMGVVTTLDVKFGIDPQTTRTRVFDMVAGRR